MKRKLNTILEKGVMIKKEGIEHVFFGLDEAFFLNVQALRESIEHLGVRR